MIAEDKLNETFCKLRIKEDLNKETYEAAILAIQEYAKLKCKELLEIVAEKSLIKDIYPKYTLDKYGDIMYFAIDKDSILNVINLDEFIT